VVILAFNLLYALVMGNILESTGIQLKERGDILSALNEEPIIFVYVLVPIIVLTEEFFFRLPLMFLTDAQPKTILIGAIFLSTIFGFTHGGWQQLPVQGFLGLILCLVFLKCGGIKEKPGKAFLSSSFVHFTFNWLLLTIALVDFTHI
jgi:membrane protease YdiL (CAAX protease family)